MERIQVTSASPFLNSSLPGHSSDNFKLQHLRWVTCGNLNTYINVSRSRLRLPTFGYNDHGTQLSEYPWTFRRHGLGMLPHDPRRLNSLEYLYINPIAQKRVWRRVRYHRSWLAPQAQRLVTCLILHIADHVFFGLARQTIHVRIPRCELCRYTAQPS